MTKFRRRTSPMSSCSPKASRSEEHTSELQSQSNLVCRLLLEKKKIAVTHLCDPARLSPIPHPPKLQLLLIISSHHTCQCIVFLRATFFPIHDTIFFVLVSTVI